MAMSRARCGRIVVGDRDMIMPYTDSKTKYVGERRAGPWNTFLVEARQENAITNGGLLNKDLLGLELNERWSEVADIWQKRVLGHGTVSHLDFANVEKDQPTNEQAPITSVNYAVSSFVSATHATDEVAMELLTAAKGDVHVAIDSYFKVRDRDVDRRKRERSVSSEDRKGRLRRHS
ncbi:hypothetical protein LTR62_007274 [Meristemomyces frigidus]|uniref:Uncharacterized protein n=1 Tax=Meristemomyces frigidus TaxID=1508187 RepID=A0AAN7TBA4_9PEZI|nr:hypothetical protein LTR62_007274 [Meristemomyces frigidus]